MKFVVAIILTLAFDGVIAQDAVVDNGGAAQYLENQKTDVYVFILKEPAKGAKDISCISEEAFGKPTYATLALNGAVTSDEYIKAFQINPKWLDSFKKKDDLFWKGPNFSKAFPKAALDQPEKYKELNCNTFFLVENDFHKVKAMLAKIHKPTREGLPPFFEAKLTFEDAFSSWVRFLGYSNSQDYVNGFMPHNAFVHARAHAMFKRYGVSDSASISAAIDRARAVSYEVLTRNGGLHPNKFEEFLFDEAAAKRRGVSLSTIVKEKKDAEMQAQNFEKNPHILRCGLNIDCGNKDQILAKLAEAVIKLREAEIPNGKYSYENGNSAMDAKFNLQQCNESFLKASKISSNVGDLMGQRDYLMGQCNSGLARLKF